MMKTNTKRTLVWVIVFTLLFSAVAIQNCEGQNINKDGNFNALEFVYNNGDNGLGFGYYKTWGGIGIVTGATFGTYHMDFEKIDHQKYKLGIAVNCTNPESDMHPGLGQGSFIAYAAICHNEYQMYNTFEGSVLPDVPVESIELGIKYCFPDDKVFCGFNYDLGQRTGSFTVGLRFNKKK